MYIYIYIRIFLLVLAKLDKSHRKINYLPTHGIAQRLKVRQV